MSTGSNPVFPTIFYNYNFSYLMNLININKSHKKLFFCVFFSKKNIKFLKFLKFYNVIHKYNLIKKNNYTYIKLYLYYFKNKNICSTFKLISRPSKQFVVSYKALRLLSKKSGSSIFILSTPIGIISHETALKQKTGGVILGFFSL